MAAQHQLVNSAAAVSPWEGQQSPRTGRLACGATRGPVLPPSRRPQPAHRPRAVPTGDLAPAAHRPRRTAGRRRPGTTRWDRPPGVPAWAPASPGGLTTGVTLPGPPSSAHPRLPTPTRNAPHRP
ncbi:hypothetical protein N7535_003463 [Penicillium sp. DV-2018c]|nr:hypothetical protein N7535_003463 [Penicillium sp. DV-2018c]